MPSLSFWAETLAAIVAAGSGSLLLTWMLNILTSESR